MVALGEGSTMIKMGLTPDLIDRREEGSVTPFVDAAIVGHPLRRCGRLASPAALPLSPSKTTGDRLIAARRRLLFAESNHHQTQRFRDHCRPRAPLPEQLPLPPLVGCAIASSEKMTARR